MLTQFNDAELSGGVPKEKLERIAEHAPAWLEQVREDKELSDEKWSLETVTNLLLLALYDVVLLLGTAGRSFCSNTLTDTLIPNSRR